MNASHKYPARLVLAIAAAAAVLVVGAATASGQEVPSSDQTSSGGGVSGTTGVGAGTAIAVSPDYPVSSGIAMPEWCCGGGTGYVPGLTTYGQATVDGHDPADRDAAIAVAVQDATAQANAAADAAGISLGAIIDMQVSATPYYAYPMMGDASGSSGSSPGSPGGGMEPAPAPAPDMYLGSVSVTITWSLG
jgi:hypothetical protein